MNRNGKYAIASLKNVSRLSPEWNEFVNWQQELILERLTRYNKVSTAKVQLQESGDITPYQHYKIDSVSPYLLEALERIQNGTYGACKYCGMEISVG